MAWSGFCRGRCAAGGWRVLAGLPIPPKCLPRRIAPSAGGDVGAGFGGYRLLLVWRISQRIVRPIDALHSAAAKGGGGQTQARVMLEVGLRELQAVAVEFNRMLDSRERFLTHLAGSEERFRTPREPLRRLVLGAGCTVPVCSHGRRD